MRAVTARSEAGPNEGAWPSANPGRGGGARITGSQRRCACGYLSDGSRLPNPLRWAPSRPPSRRPRPRLRRTAELGSDRSPDLAAGASSGGIGRGVSPAAQARRAHARPPPLPSSPPSLPTLPSPDLPSAPQLPLGREEEPFPTSQRSPGRFPFGEKEETRRSKKSDRSPRGLRSGSLPSEEPAPSSAPRSSPGRCRIDSAPQRAPGPAEPTPRTGPGPAMPGTAAAVAVAAAGTATAATAAGPGPGWGLEAPQWG